MVNKYRVATINHIPPCFPSFFFTPPVVPIQHTVPSRLKPRLETMEMDHRTRRELHIWMPRAPEKMRIYEIWPYWKRSYTLDGNPSVRFTPTKNHQPPHIPEARFVGEDSSKLMGSPMSSFTSNSGEGVGILKEAI